MQIDQLRRLYNSPYGWVIKIASSLAILAAFFLAIDLDSLKRALDPLGPEVLLVLLVLTIVRNLSGSLRFKILTDMKHPVRLSEIMKQYFVASLFNNVLPTALGGDAVRFLMLAKQGIPKAHAGTMIMVERLIGFYALIMIALISCFFWAAPTKVRWLVILLAVANTGVISLVLVKEVEHGWMMRFSVLASIKSALDAYKSNSAKLLLVFSHSIVFQLISILISYYIAIALGMAVSVLPFLTLVPLVWFCTMIPIGFGGLGTREVSFAYLFSLIGVAAEQSLLISLGTYFTLLLSGVIGAGYLAASLRSRHEALY
ncbi:MAG: lysylphosphatidylglycerol synthase transmembrane domain-containing protein [Planctomycetota bacterium]|jgi:uncharacterized membrane protein YbhN (UPF0104 family)